MPLDNLNKQHFEPTRAACDAALKNFTPQMGEQYTHGRNFDRGAGQHRDVSMLSPYVRRRIVLEQDLVTTAIQAHGLEMQKSSSKKFFGEVILKVG